MKEAGVALVGGHSIEDPEIKYGLAVTGVVHPKKILTNAKAKARDKLILTKSLGTGIIATALKGEMASEEAVRKIVESMVTLNRTASELMTKYEAHACTDITGFSFIGHALEMAIASQVGMVIQSKSIPIFPEAMEYAKLGLIPGGAYSNRDFFSCKVEVHADVPDLLVHILYDPQTSGGLLISLPSEEAERLVTALIKEEHIHSSIVGEVVEEPRGKIKLL
jgi:selenide,water dikinase